MLLLMSYSYCSFNLFFLFRHFDDFYFDFAPPFFHCLLSRSFGLECSFKFNPWQAVVNFDPC